MIIMNDSHHFATENSLQNKKYNKRSESAADKSIKINLLKEKHIYKLNFLFLFWRILTKTMESQLEKSK